MILYGGYEHETVGLGLAELLTSCELGSKSVYFSESSLLLYTILTIYIILLSFL